MAGGASFDDWADQYDAIVDRAIAPSGETRSYFARKRVEWLAGRLAEMGLAAHTILDFGCGTGMTTPWYFELLKAKRVIGIDVSAKCLAAARRKCASPAAEYHLAEHYTPREDADLAFSCGVLHHIPPRERAAAIRYVRDCLCPGGIVAVWENNAWSLAARYTMWANPFDRGTRPLSARGVRRLLGAEGLTVLRTDYLFIFPRLLRVFRGLEPNLARLPLGAQFQVLGRKE
ncbi:MAG: class I SAM-dependent methyltransferase [Thermoguttaceae bacterium]|jgi:SAM-dependent methyltransferase|nr:class I SAM-dependent methyltransferase [Thermoguttaceae bacterium]